MLSEPLYVFFDGQCPMCIGWVKFLLDRDGFNRMRFAPLQSEWTHRFFEDHDLPHPGVESVVVYDGLRFHFGSEAILTLTSAMPGIWKIFRHARVIPLKFRERTYDWVARNRTRWFNPHQTCWVPREEDWIKFPELSAQPHRKPGQ